MGSTETNYVVYLVPPLKQAAYSTALVYYAYSTVRSQFLTPREPLENGDVEHHDGDEVNRLEANHVPPRQSAGPAVLIESLEFAPTAATRLLQELIGGNRVDAPVVTNARFATESELLRNMSVYS